MLLNRNNNPSFKIKSARLGFFSKECKNNYKMALVNKSTWESSDACASFSLKVKIHFRGPEFHN